MDHQGKDTMQVLWRVFARSLAACCHGGHPILDWQHKAWVDPGRAQMANEPLSQQGFVFAITGVTADLDELCNEYKLAHVNSTAPCFWCPCNTTGMPWNDFSVGALYRELMCTVPASGGPVRAPNDHPIWTIPGVTVFCVLWDILHGLDLGPTLHVLGNILADWMLDQRFGVDRGSRPMALTALWARLPRLPTRHLLANL